MPKKKKKKNISHFLFDDNVQIRDLFDSCVSVLCDKLPNKMEFAFFGDGRLIGECFALRGNHAAVTVFRYAGNKVSHYHDSK